MTVFTKDNGHLIAFLVLTGADKELVKTVIAISVNDFCRIVSNRVRSIAVLTTEYSIYF